MACLRSEHRSNPQPTEFLRQSEFEFRTVDRDIRYRSSFRDDAELWARLGTENRLPKGCQPPRLHAVSSCQIQQQSRGRGCLRCTPAPPASPYRGEELPLRLRGSGLHPERPWLWPTQLRKTERAEYDRG